MSLKNISTKKENIKLSNEIDKQRIPEHIAIIMDGNGRWATQKGLPSIIIAICSGILCLSISLDNFIFSFFVDMFFKLIS
jgi:hypothetical protein